MSGVVTPHVGSREEPLCSMGTLGCDSALVSCVVLTAVGAASWLRGVIEEIGASSTGTLDEEKHSLRSDLKYDEELSGNILEVEFSVDGRV